MKHRIPKQVPAKRRGMAPLEFVLVLPLLGGMTYGLFSIVKTALHGLNTVQTARHETWKALPTVLPSDPLKTRPPVKDGSAEHVATRPVEYDGWWQDADVKVRSGSQSIAGTWDRRSVPFDPGQGPFRAHRRPADLIGQSVAGGAAAGSLLQAFAAGMNLPGNPAVLALAAVSQAMDPLVVAAGATLEALRPFLQLARIGAEVLRAFAIATFQFGLANFLTRVIRLLVLGDEAFRELNRAAQGSEVNWRGINTSGAFP